MRLHLLRHASAEREAPSGLDADRVLTALGKTEAESAAAFVILKLRELDQRLDRVVCSPAARATQTAEPVCRAVGVGAVIEPRLSPDHPLSAAVEVVQELIGSDGDVMVIGHNPTISRLAAWLGAEVESLHTGELITLELVETGGRILGREIGRHRPQ